MPDFVIGRPQCPDINNPTPHSIPRGDNPDGANFVKEAFGLTDEEMVAIMGTFTYLRLSSISGHMQIYSWNEMTITGMLHLFHMLHIHSLNQDLILHKMAAGILFLGFVSSSKFAAF